MAVIAVEDPFIRREHTMPGWRGTIQIREGALNFEEAKSGRGRVLAQITVDAKTCVISNP